MSERKQDRRMRVSFDLDEVLFVSPKTHKTEPALPFPLGNFFRERLRYGTPALIRELRKTNPNIDQNIFHAIHAVHLDTFPGYKSDGNMHSFLEKYYEEEEL